LLVEQFLKKMGREREHALAISPQALSVLMNYSWPGNVRELENALESAVALNRTGVIVPEDLPEKVRTDVGEIKRVEDFFAELPSMEEVERRYLVHVLKVTGGNKVKTSEILGIDRRTLYRKAEKYKLLV
jgi:DNA-binding NtrC family response regulator